MALVIPFLDLYPKKVEGRTPKKHLHAFSVAFLTATMRWQQTMSIDKLLGMYPGMG